VVSTFRAEEEILHVDYYESGEGRGPCVVDSVNFLVSEEAEEAEDRERSYVFVGR